MARRKPQHVERNRQQNARQREIEQHTSGSSDAAYGGASNEPSDVIGIDDSDEMEDAPNGQVAAATNPPLSKRPRIFFRTNLRSRRSVLSWQVQLQVGVPSKLVVDHAPWSETRRAQALWVSVPVDAMPQLREQLLLLEANGTFSHRSGSSHQTIGFVVHDDLGNVSPDPSRLILGDLTDGWGPFQGSPLEADVVTMEVKRTATVSATAGTAVSSRDVDVAYEWRIGIDWHGLKERPSLGIHELMLWLLYHSKHVGNQWRHAYPREIDVMFERGNSWKNEVKTSFNAHDVFTQIDVKRQLARDVSNIPAHVTATESALLPTLRDYQKAALSWMLAREGVQCDQPLEEPTDASPDLASPKRLSRCVRFSWPSNPITTTTAVPSGGGVELLFDIFSNEFSLTTEAKNDEQMVTNIKAVRGGILADEMGLGKTVEVIALVLSNPSPQTLPVVLTDVAPPSESSNAMEDDEFVCGCICGSDDECEPGWVQCDLCDLWHHRLCTGFDSDGAPSFTISSNSPLSPTSFVCFRCQVKHHLMLSCKTTLIVSPESIHDQWESELKRHVKPGALKLLRYPGVKSVRTQLQGKGPSAEWRVLANLGIEMGSYDIVLTTYEVLASDLHHIPTSLSIERRASTRRKHKKYAFIASPLVFLKFWRVCMDEAQVGVENTQLQAALTVAELHSNIQWIVTGTPFSTQLMDLYGCFMFLRLESYCDEQSGSRDFKAQLEDLFLGGATDRVFDLLLWDGHSKSRCGGGLLWRTNKKDVFSQLGLPAQSEDVVWCRLSNVERLFYDKQETEVIKALCREQERRRRLLGERYDEQGEVGETVWHRLLLLRQICCHPQVGQILRSIGGSDRADRRRIGRGARAMTSCGGDSVGMKVLTTDDFLLQLIERCRRECEEAQRKLISAHNGHASLALIGDDFATAIIKYVLSVQLIRSNWDDFRADLLPRLHILDNLATTVRRAFDLGTRMNQEQQGSETTDCEVNETTIVVDADREDDEDADHTTLSAPETDVSPKNVSLMPDLPVLLRTITESGLVKEGADTKAIAKECEVVEAAADRIRRFYLAQGECRHSAAWHQFESTRSSIETTLYQPNLKRRGKADDDTGRGAMLCSSSVWWLEMFEFLKQLPHGQAHVMQLVNRLRAHLYALGTPWSTSFVEKFHDVHGLALTLMNELTTLYKKRTAITTKLLSQSQQTPTKAEIEMSGNCRKCRDARDGPICWHCKFYKELEGYKQHMLGIDNTIATASVSASWTVDLVGEDGEEEKDGKVMTASTTATTSLILDIFRQVSSGTRLLLRENRSALSAADVHRLTKALQEGVQHETELWANLLREWNHAKKLFQAQHQRLGSLDELEMAQMKIRLRFPGEVVQTATDKLYKLAPYEVPLKVAALDAERVVADAELKQKQSELRYLKHLQLTNETADTNNQTEGGDAAISSSTCVVCLEDMRKQRVAMLPCAHKTCLKCSDRLAAHLRSSRSIRCPTCRRIFRVDERKEVENDVNRAKEVALATRMVNARAPTADSSVQLVRSGFSSKIDAILRRVRALATANPELKALVFTQWQDMMGVIAAALQLNGIKCFTYTSKKHFHRVLHAFKLFPDACVLALPFKIGANGLNIIEATEVLLIEPLLNTSMEAQAINRVHRIGQTKATRVHRFVVENSVEERIHWLGRSTQTHRIHQYERESEIKDEEVEVEMAHDESVIVGRQEKETLTLGQLQALLNGRAMVANSEGDIDGAVDANGSDHPFWQQRVELNGRSMTRREARELLERRHAAEQRASSASPSDSSEQEPVTLVVDREMRLSIAHELLHLEISPTENDALMSSTEGLPEFVDMARQHIHTELRVWRASR